MPIPLRIKICGVTTPEDVHLCAEAGADAIGLNFYTQSPRCIDFAEAHAIMRALPAFVEPVGLFVNESLASVFKKLNQLGRIRLIQWHGEQRELSDVYPFRLIAALSVAEQKHLREITSYLEMCRTLGALPAAVLKLMSPRSKSITTWIEYSFFGIFASGGCARAFFPSTSVSPAFTRLRFTSFNISPAAMAWVSWVWPAVTA